MGILHSPDFVLEHRNLTLAVELFFFVFRSENAFRCDYFVAAFLTQTVQLDDSTVKFEIWDTAGQERYRSLAPMYYRGASAAIIVYDITNPDSFTGAKSWVKELQRRGDPNVVIALAGNKADLESRRKVEFEEANAYAEENGILHLETSAKNANNVKALFVEIAKKLPKNPPQPEREAFPLAAPQQPKSNCC